MFQNQPGVRMEEKRRSRCSSFHIRLLLLFFLIFYYYRMPYYCIIPTEFLSASSTWHRTPSHTRGHAEISEPLGSQRWWHSDSYSVRENTKFVLPVYKHIPILPFCYGTVYIHVLTRKVSAFFRTAGRFTTYVVHTQHLVAKHPAYIYSWLNGRNVSQ